MVTVEVLSVKYILSFLLPDSATEENSWQYSNFAPSQSNNGRVKFQAENAKGKAVRVL
jgi:hypothetical protein